jgi:hypothetical protein
MKKYIFRQSSIIEVVAAGVILISLQFLGVPSGASNARLSKAVSLQSLVVSNVSGFTSESVDKVGGGPTGRIDFNESTSADCDPSGLTRSGWVASELRYFDNDANDPETYLLLCVTQLRTAQDAVVNRKEVIALGGASQSSAVHVPGAYVHAVGPAVQIFFIKGIYFVWIVATTLSSNVKALPLGATLAHREYALLPK